jgi:hypothetical protein
VARHGYEAAARSHRRYLCGSCIVDAQSINDIDSTALGVLREFRAELEREGSTCGSLV